MKHLVLRLQSPTSTAPSTCPCGSHHVLADIAYVVYGTALTYGIDLDSALREVHRSNMSKLGNDGKPLIRDDGKVLKSERYFPPDIASVLGLEDRLSAPCTDP